MKYIYTNGEIEKERKVTAKQYETGLRIIKEKTKNVLQINTTHNIVYIGQKVFINIPGIYAHT